MKRLGIADFIKACEGALLLDVRAPAEYAHAHIPGAVNLPLFTDEERKVVGTLYKQQSREAAIKTGLDYFGPKMRGMVEEVESNIEQRNKSCNFAQDDNMNEELKASAKELQTPNLKPQTSNPVFIYCWRGGMRSGAVSWLLNLYGFQVTLLAGGYKAFRNYVLQSFAQPYSFKIVGGYTGSGKTEVLQQLQQKGKKIIDLEGIASHKGSAFGNINMPAQPTQEMFENILGLALKAINHEDENGSADPLKCTKTIWLEDESQRIGRVNIPAAIWNTMRSAPVYFLEVPFEERLKHLTEEYGRCDKETLSDAMLRIQKRLGPLETKTALQHLQEGNIKECFSILLKYYDKHYLKGLHKRTHLDTALTKLECQTVTIHNASFLLPAPLTL